MQLFLKCSPVLESGNVVLYYCFVIIIINKFIIKQKMHFSYMLLQNSSRLYVICIK
jgi:hypothetical protein